jgi:hypothetical protein
MAQEKFFKDRQPKGDGSHHNHDGQHSIRQKLEAAQAQFMAWRHGQVEAHESGHAPDPFPYPTNPYLPEGQDTEIELFVSDEVRLAEVREELGKQV